MIWPKDILTAKGIETGYQKDKLMHFQVRSPFTMTLTCRRKDETVGCDPLGAIRLRFSEYVEAEDIRKIRLVGEDGFERQAEPNWDGATRHARFAAPLPMMTRFKLVLPDGLSDQDGRPLTGLSQGDLEIETGEYPPLAKFTGRFGILELEDSPYLPVTVRNVEQGITAKAAVSKTAPHDFRHSLQEAWNSLSGSSVRFGPDRRQQSGAHRRSIIRMMQQLHSPYSHRDSILRQISEEVPREDFDLPREVGRNETEVVGVHLDEPGFYLVELESRDLAKAFLEEKYEKMYVPTGALVTNMAVHLKQGRENSLVWVTSLDEGQPVEEADIHILNCEGKTVASARTNEDGVAYINQNLTDAQSVHCSGGRYHRGLFVFAEKQEDVSFLHTSWDDGIEPWRVGGNRYGRYKGNTPNMIHTVLDRGLYRAGETVHMKHFARQHGLQGMGFPENYGEWRYMEIIHMGSEEKILQRLDWSEQGTSLADWEIPKSAKLGQYEIFLKRDQNQRFWNAVNAGSFQVQEFKVPLAKASLGLPSEKLVRATELPVDMAVHYLAGGGAGGLKVDLRAEITEGYNYFGSKELRGFRFNSGTYKRSGQAGLHQVKAVALTLDEKGQARYVLSDLPESNRVIQVLTELAYKDPNGEIRTEAKTARILPSKWNIGIKTDHWLSKGEDLNYQIALRDIEDKPVPDQRVALRITQKKTLTHRKKLAGGVYGYEHEEIENPVGTVCEGETDEMGMLNCDWQSDLSGLLIAEALVTSPEGLELVTNASTWVPGEDPWWFDVSSSDVIDLLPERNEYQPGETARFQVRMPFPEATALVTYEREGVQDYRIVELEGRAPVIDVPVSDDFAPNMHVSVLLVQGRNGDVKPTAMVDLGRPSFKIGTSQIRVGWQKHRLKVEVQPEKSSYQLREMATVAFKVTTEDGTALPPKSEIAVAVVDEGLLSLKENQSWKLLRAMMGLRANEVSTMTAQMQVVGKRHFGQKAIPDGGGGGESVTRENFDTLLHWQGRVVLDDQGTAKISFPMNDSLTRFRIVAVASGGAEKFGTGQGSVRATKDLMVFAGNTPFAREGDRIMIPYTFRNTTKKEMLITAHLTRPTDGTDLGRLEFKLEPGKSQEMTWLAETPLDFEKVDYLLESYVEDKLADRLKTEQEIQSVHPVRTIQGTFTQLVEKTEIPVKLPQDALGLRGGLKVRLDRSIAGSLDGVRDYMRRYPWNCFEQQSSRYVSTGDREAWQELMEKMPSYLDRQGFLKYFPTMQYGSDILSAYILNLSLDLGWEIPKQQREKLLRAMTQFAEGRAAPNGPFAGEYALLRKLSAIDVLSRYGRARASMLDSLSFEPIDLPTSALLDWFSILRRVEGIAGVEELQVQSADLLRSRIRFDGPMMRFTTGSDDDLWYFMSNRTVNALDIIRVLIEFDEWREDIPRFMKGAIARQSHGHWRTSTANALGTVTVQKFVEAFEAEKITGETVSRYANQQGSFVWTDLQNGNDGQVLPWQGREEDLLEISHKGTGAPWLTVQSRAAVPYESPKNAGYVVRKKVTALRQKEEGRISIGDMFRVRLEIEARAASTWVAIEDPLPPGSVIMGRGLGGESRSAQKGEDRSQRWWMAYQEKAFDAVRTYYQYLPGGSHQLEYTYQVNTAGSYHLPATRIEAMYNPEIYGVRPNAPVTVVE